MKYVFRLSFTVKIILLVKSKFKREISNNQYNYWWLNIIYWMLKLILFNTKFTIKVHVTYIAKTLEYKKC